MSLKVSKVAGEVNVEVLSQRAPIEPVLVPGSTSTLYTALADEEVFLEIVNNQLLAATVTLYIVPPGATAGTGNVILNAASVTTTSVGIRLGPYHIEEGWTIQGLASVADAITLHFAIRRN